MLVLTHRKAFKDKVCITKQFPNLFTQQTNKDKSLIGKNVTQLIALFKKVKDIQKIEIRQMLRNLDEVFDDQILEPLQLLLRTTTSQQANEKKEKVGLQSTSREELNKIASQMRNLDKKHFQSSLGIYRLKQHLQRGIADFQTNIQQPMKQISKQIKEFGSLSPFALGIENAIQSIQEAQRKGSVLLKEEMKKESIRLKFLRSFGKTVIGVPQFKQKQFTLKQWQLSGRGLAEIESFDLRSSNLKAIPLQLDLFPNLITLMLYDNKINQIEELSKLKNLQKLILGNNQISDLKAIEKLTNLTQLGLGGNQISDLKAIEKLTNLTVLGLANNKISNIGNVLGLPKLIIVWISGNPILESEKHKIQAAKKTGVQIYQ